eukprot:CAMPEP_0195533452 /NCGR_PEP_ID=MMETSP0794_2-20130614/40497_1 /TAXON_ID=515487 /ORGANISM="Stephanopyxis turris, Strain CCMP 815" /LENGTH=56 /DNA_ID=CAMNT_0040665977 /DNA_START=42 /DNA_END=209 /DNA_ORIENTATION=+
MAKPHLIDLIDSEWAQDKLEDDDISMPAGVDFVQRDVDFLESVDPREKSKSDKDKW